MTSSRLKRLYYQSGHRGTKELDILLGRFAEAHLHTLNPAELDAYEALLEAEETDLYQWLTQQQPVPAAYDTPLLHKIIAFLHDRAA